MDYTPFVHLATSLGLGLLVGLQRERAESELAGIRTFPLITITGTVCGLFAERLDSIWIVAAGLVAVSLLVVAANLVRGESLEEDDAGIGQTTEIAILLMFLVGAFLPIGPTSVAVATGAGTAILLSLKRTLHQVSGSMTREDVRAIMQLAAIAFIIMPVLPDADYGPYSVLNPKEIWTMVVLIVGLSVTAYFIYKWGGKSVGTIAGGILGGLISSTATTVTYAKRTAGTNGAGRLAALVIFIASTISFVRVLIEVGVVIPGQVGVIGPPILAMVFFMALICLGLYLFNNEGEEEELPDPDNPAQLKAALIFGALYALIIFAVAVAKDYFGQEGLYVVSIISGLTDVDAITLSLSNTIKDGGLTAERGWSLILIAALSNMIFKAGMAVVLGSRSLAKYIIGATALTLAAGGLVLWLWPESWVIGNLAELFGTGAESAEPAPAATE
ncbi:uncharacterized membrane protein (DUF4010 family) [Lewinella marina]|uniref:DUF4010 domain-containing protein n=1 Tax=Neolewinella marina TaxID=438751 RepID=A0A2G0CK07_9BACT|nr:MgtC/SapB family protein [Neolewinella marina]NJB84505.1 uncharacterized membrane protein (DUF4010 family) [Neolewinella marina]PHL00307.1 hypothetical protein CGL56_04540 [Neolewinella marina]